MNILHFCPSQSFSGLEQYVLELATDQLNKGHDVRLGVYPESPLEKLASSHKFKVCLYDTDKFAEAYKFWKNNRDFIESLDVIHLHSTQEVPRFYLISQLQRFFGKNKPKIVLQLHLWVNHSKKDALHKMFYSIINEVWCSSVPARISLQSTLPVDSEIIKIVNYGRNIEKLEAGFFSREEAREKLKLPADSIIFGCVSRIEKSKGIKEFLHGALSLKKKYPNVKFVLIGGPSANNPQALKYFKNLESQLKEIIYLGHISESFKYLKAFDVYVLPSYKECFSLSLLDAQLAELPIVGGGTGGTPEVVVEDRTGWLFDPASPIGVLEGVERALEDKDRWTEYGQRAAERVRSEFDQRLVFSQILKNYE